MNFPFYIARRYLFSRKSINIINIISIISTMVVAFVTMAMIVVLSAFNGIEELIDDRFSYFDADLSVIPLEDKTFDKENFPYAWFDSLPQIEAYSNIIEENVFAQYEDNQRVVKIKGVDSIFISMSRLDSMIFDGSADLHIENNSAAIIGIGVKYDLNLRLFEQTFNPLYLSAIIRGKKLSRNQEDALNRKGIPVSGVFSINVDFDSEYVIVPFDFAAALLDYENEASALEIKLKPGVQLEEFREIVSKKMGNEYQVRSRYEKNQVIYKTNKSEKWITFMILGFILLIASFNIIASLTMLIIDKKKDIRILLGMGATTSQVRRVFFYEGLLINVVGAGVGLILGYILCILQMEYGLIPLEGGLVPYYPVQLQFNDFVAVFALVFVSGFLSSIAPVRIFTKRYF